MRPKGTLATVIAMAILNFTLFANLNWSHRSVVAATLIIFVAWYVVLWFYWQGRNWARLLVLFISVVAIVDLVNLVHPHGKTLLYDFSVISNAALGIVLLYWLNRPNVLNWFRGGTDAPSS